MITATTIRRKLAGNPLDRVKALAGQYTKVGYPSERSKLHPNSHIGVAAQAAVHEYGSESQGIPARPFMKQAWDRNLTELKAMQAGILSRVARGALSSTQGVAMLGEWFTAKIKMSITDGTFQSLKRATAIRKGSSKPLIDTGIMRASVTHVEGRR